MGLWGKVKSTAKAAWDSGPIGFASNTAKHGFTGAVKRTIPGQIATDVYNEAYGKPAEQVKQGYADAASKTRQAGYDTAERYRTGRENTLGYYDNATGKADPHVPKYSQNYYQNFNQYQPTIANDYFNQRQKSGYANPMQDRLQNRQATENQSYLEGELGDLRNFATGGTNTDRRTRERSDVNALPEHLDNRMMERYDFAGRPTETSSVLGDLNGMTAGATGNRVLGDLQAGGGDSGRFLEDFDMNSTAALGETYGRLSNEGPSYEEDFYTSLLEGGNPHFNQLKDDFVKDTRKAAAARGGFMSGRSADMETRGLSRLTADEFANRGQLASLAGGARRDRLGQVLQGAEALDGHLLDRARLRGDVSVSRDEMVTDLAKHSDTEGRQLADLRLRGADQEDSFRREDQDDLDTVARDISDRDAKRQDALDTLARDSDSTRTTRMSDYADNLSTADTNRETRRSNLDTLTRETSDSMLDRDKQLDDLAGRAADEQENIAGRRFDAAGEASKEALQRANDEFDRAMRLGDTKAAIDQTYRMAEIGALNSTELSAIGHELAAAGVDAATIQALIGDLLTIGKEAGKAAASGGAAA